MSIDRSKPLREALPGMLEAFRLAASQVEGFVEAFQWQYDPNLRAGQRAYRAAMTRFVIGRQRVRRGK